MRMEGRTAAAERKAALRREARARLDALGPEGLRRASDEAARRIWTLPEVAAARTLLVFAALADEMPTGAAVAEARRRGITVVYPRCLPEAREMVLHRVVSADELRPGAFGIAEPDAACPVADAAEVDAALVPGLAWDRRGMRLGRGAGFYDRLFARPEWRGFRCGWMPAALEVPEIPREAWDAPLEAVATEREAWRRG